MGLKDVSLMVSGALLLTMVGCGWEKARQADTVPSPELVHSAALPHPVIARVRQQVEADLTRHLGSQQAAVLKALSNATSVPAGLKQPLVVQALTDPWTGLMALERQGLRVAELATSGPEHLPAMIAAIEAGMDRIPEAITPLPSPTRTNGEEHVDYLIAVLEQAHRLRDKALQKLDPEDRRFLFEHAAALVEHFTPQVSELTDRTRPQAEADRRFSQLVAERLDYAALIAAAQVLTSLAEERWLQRVEQAFHGRQALPSPPSWVTGEVLLIRQTPHGLIVIGGPGANTYDLDQRVALVLDLGGNDTYRGAIAAAAVVEHGHSVVIDLAGNDTYHATPLGLATGRLGVGLLIDRAGDDVYHLAPGSGGTGFAGLGILFDRAGHDQYLGTRFTQGAAAGGLGLLLDADGQDVYNSFGYAIGFGGPLGVGAVVDVAGDDRYQCGEHYPSDYNAADAPDAASGDPRFQYDCFGLGTGAGKRMFTKDAEQLAYGLAGGWGILLDLAGNDRYRSSNFSQGAGYFFGMGLKLDLDGNDEHVAARYGHAAGAHHAVGLFVDAAGHDTYTSTGPVYNAGTAWDRSVMLAIDAGSGNDRYDFARSSGLGIADHHAWSLFIEEGGKDRYLVPTGLGRAFHNSLSGFFDLAGEDEYAGALQPGPVGRGNGHVLLDQSGAIFVDR